MNDQRLEAALTRLERLAASADDLAASLAEIGKPQDAEHQRGLAAGLRLAVGTIAGALDNVPSDSGGGEIVSPETASARTIPGATVWTDPDKQRPQ